MYFQNLDSFHIILTSLFLIITIGIVFFRYQKHLKVNKKILNYTIHKKYFLIRIASLILAFLFLATTFLGPVWLMKNPTSSVKGIDCIWLLDVSMSMDTEDVINNNSSLSRLSKAKWIIENYMITHPENRYGLVIFAGTSRLISPLTTENSSILTFLASIDSKSMREGGTDFHQALQLSLDRFETQASTPHAIVLLSDGGDTEDAINATSVKNLFIGKNANLITIGIGNIKPSPIPIGRNPIGETVYKKFQWETVLSGMNPESLNALANIGGWSYLEGNSLEKNLENALTKITRQTFQKTWDISDDITVRFFIAMSLFFFLVFLLFPSSFLKRCNDL